VWIVARSRGGWARPAAPPYWPDHNLIVETDGAATHLTLAAFEQDLTRDAHLTALGYRVIRISWRQLTERPRETARLLRQMLSCAGR
jgi:very-short-patch-repair endonuclease